MIPRRAVLLWVCLAALSGCATPSSSSRLAGLPEAMCKHCNCLMPAGLDPNGMCPVCDCGRRNHHCVRGR